MDNVTFIQLILVATLVALDKDSLQISWEALEKRVR